MKLENIILFQSSALSKCPCLLRERLSNSFYSQMSESCLAAGFSCSPLFILTICSSSLRCGEQIRQHFIRNNVIKPQPPNWMKLQKQLSQSILKTSPGVPTPPTPKGKLEKGVEIFTHHEVSLCVVYAVIITRIRRRLQYWPLPETWNANFALTIVERRDKGQTGELVILKKSYN